MKFSVLRVLATSVAVCVSAEPVGVVDVAAPVVAPTRCDCGGPVNECVARYDTKLKAQEQELVASWQTRMNALNTNHRSELTKMQQDLERERTGHSEARQQIAGLTNREGSEVNDLKKSLSTLKNDFSAKLQTEEQARAKTERMLAEKERELKQARETQEAQQRKLVESDKLSAEVKVLTTKLSSSEQVKAELASRLENYEGKLFSNEHFELMTRNFQKVSLALLQASKKNVNRLFNADVFELMRLQALVLSHKLQPHRELVQTSALEFAEQHQLPERLQTIAEQLQPHLQQTRDLVDRTMDRVIRHLSIHDPEIEQMFPTGLKDRMLAFLYLFTVFWVIQTVLTYIFSAALVPLRLVFLTILPAVTLVLTYPLRLLARTPPGQWVGSMLRGKPSKSSENAATAENAHNNSAGKGNDHVAAPDCKSSVSGKSVDGGKSSCGGSISAGAKGAPDGRRGSRNSVGPHSAELENQQPPPAPVDQQGSRKSVPIATINKRTTNTTAAAVVKN